MDYFTLIKSSLSKMLTGQYVYEFKSSYEELIVKPHYFSAFIPSTANHRQIDEQNRRKCIGIIVFVAIMTVRYGLLAAFGDYYPILEALLGDVFFTESPLGRSLVITLAFLTVSILIGRIWFLVCEKNGHLQSLTAFICETEKTSRTNQQFVKYYFYFCIFYIPFITVLSAVGHVWLLVMKIRETELSWKFAFHLFWCIPSQVMVMEIFSAGCAVCGIMSMTSNIVKNRQRNLQTRVALVIGQLAQLDSLQVNQDVSQELRPIFEAKKKAVKKRIVLSIYGIQEDFRNLTSLLFDTNKFLGLLYLTQTYVTSPVMASLMYTAIFAHLSPWIRCIIIIQDLVVMFVIFSCQGVSSGVYHLNKDLSKNFTKLYHRAIDVMTIQQRMTLKKMIKSAGNTYRPHAIALGSHGPINSSLVKNNITESIFMFIMMCDFLQKQ